MSKFRKETNLLLRALQNGNKSKFDELYLFTFDHIKGMVLKYLIDKTEWKDVVNQTYLQVLQHIQTFDNSKDGYNWMCKIAHNVALDFNKNKAVTVESDDSFNDVFVYMEDKILESCDLYHELSLLSRKDQELIWLRFWEELNYNEIARRVNSKKSTVHFRISKILKTIETNLKK